MIRNLDDIRARDPRLYEALSDLIQHNGNLEQQVNGNRTGQPLPPPAIDGLTVTGQNGHFHAQITHTSEFYRGVQYYLEYSNNAGFAEPHVVHLGDAREHTMFLGNGTYYFRAHAAYASSAPGPAAYHGGTGNPQPVSGGGVIGGPKLLAPQGSGTGAPGQGLSGPGPIPFRSASGAPPVRGKTASTGSIGAGGSPGGSLPAGPQTGLPGGLTSGAAGSGTVVGSGAVFDVYANWTTALYDPTQLSVNTQIVITDRNFIVYVVQLVGGVNKWVYESGTYAVTQSAIAGLHGFDGGALGTNDTGLLIEVTNFAHVLKWSGSAWGWGPGESGSGYFSDFAVAPSGSGWHACDGSAGVAYLKADGTTGTVTLPDTAGTASYRKNASSYVDTISPATRPTISGHTETGAASITDTPVTINNPASGGTPATVATSDTEVDAGHQHNLTSTNAPIALPGDPIAHYQAITYFRQ